MTQPNVDQALRIALQHHEAGRLQQAEQVYRQILAAAPEHVVALHHLGLIAHQFGRKDVAVDLIRRAIALRPDYAEAHSNLGNVLKERGLLDEAVAAYGNAIALNPTFPDAYNNLGIVLRHKGQLDEAIAAYRKAVSLRPEYAEAYNNLGNALANKGQLDEAIAAYHKAVSLRPDYAEAYSNLGGALMDKGLIDEAIDACVKAIALNPESPDAHNNLGNAHKARGDLDGALAAYRTAVALKPTAEKFQNNLVYAVCFHSQYGPQEILEEARAWARQHADPLAVHILPHDNDRSPDRPLRIGYVSTSFCDHVVGRNILPVLENHDHRQFQIHCFSGIKDPDPVAHRFRLIADRWHEVTGMTDADLAQLVRRERIDVLVDLNLHMEGSRLLTFARKPAPVQATWAGYPGTTGLSTIDYRLTDPYLDPPGQGDEFYSEKSIRLPHTFWCFRPVAQGPEVNPLPALQNGFVTFGCLNNFCKVTDIALDLWVQVMRAVNDSRLLILSPSGDHRDRVLRRFNDGGVETHRVTFAAKEHLGAYLHLYHQFDIALDPLPYTGHSTSLDAFWMGVPVVTLAGKTVAARGGVSIASNLGLTELIANTSEEYVAIAARLAGDLGGLAELRSTMRHRMQNSSLMDERQFTADLENAYRVMWKRWCSGPQSRT